MKILGILLVLAGVFLAIEGYIHMRISQGIKAKITAELIDSQNLAIKEKALKTDKYKQALPKIEEKIITKYKNIYLKDTTCESKLEEIRNAMDLYFANPAKP